MKRVLIVTCVVLGVVGCSGQQDVPAQTGVPSTSTSAAPEPGPSPTVDEEQEVIDVATAYFTAWDQMLTSGVLDEPSIRAIAEEPYATEALISIDEMISPGVRQTGSLEYQVEAVDIDGDTASLVMCIAAGDSSVTFNGESAVPEYGAVEMSFKRAEDGWKMVGRAPHGECTQASE